jgi:hypothetical protein
VTGHTFVGAGNEQIILIRVNSLLPKLNTNKLPLMGTLLYPFAIILIIVWSIGFIGYGAGGFIHIFLVIAFIAVIIRVIQESKYPDKTQAV